MYIRVFEINVTLKLSLLKKNKPVLNKPVALLLGEKTSGRLKNIKPYSAECLHIEYKKLINIDVALVFKNKNKQGISIFFIKSRLTRAINITDGVSTRS